MAANRGQSMAIAAKNVWQRGGPLGFYQGLIPWAWIEGKKIKIKIKKRTRLLRSFVLFVLCFS